MTSKIQRLPQFLFLFLFSITGIFAQNQFSKKEVLDDFSYLKNALEEAHYNLYFYTPKSEFESNYNAVRNQIQKDSFNLLETITLFQKVITKVDNGHTFIPFPGNSYGKYAYAGGTLFPLEIAFENGKSLVRKNWSNNPRINQGSEIISINNNPIEEILEKMYPLISAERTYFKKAKIELTSFPRLYWQVFGEQQQFGVDIKENDSTTSYTLSAINLIDDYEMKREEVIQSQMELKIINDVAYLKPGAFGGDESKFRKFIDSSFAVIKNKQFKNLIIDLRNNPGGDDSFSDYLVSYIADKPFKWNASFNLKTSKILKDHVRKRYDTTQVFWKEVLSHKDGDIYEYPFENYQPQKENQRFNGKVYVLVNRQSHSQATLTAAQIQDYGFGTIVGEETGEYASLIASIFQIELPNTKIPVYISKGRIIRVNGNAEPKGVIPDILIQDHLLDEKDEIMEGLLQRLNRNLEP
ncbi:S41 family peptidase [Flagellimonas zhangzhouensis]|uniref:Peptidase family S41 n=1 Tax=Flagellimonas zhangzhouensis TaxID=1073328 RepID=A0A1H2QET2_9FLAO|nr:S41 family peptidase [Allomuricauda zhangzhouensis]SDQ51475.1 Peptidase family S41 [Allomuricauda zhangzhouensis]SDW04909.1 Peptidase family S41 [Allomuricauda zhangzhouensis]